MAIRRVVFALWAGLALPAAAWAAAFDDTPGRPGEWGFRPHDGKASAVNPPGFVWRPQGGVTYELECARDRAFRSVAYRAKGIEFNCHCPPQQLSEGPWHWRVRSRDRKGGLSGWSRLRSFTVDRDAVVFPMPSRGDLVGRIPTEHPRLFVRPEDIPKLRALAQGEFKPQYDGLVKQCERLLEKPPATAEPPRYPKGMKRGSDAWRKIWWGNRRYVAKVLQSAATLAFTHRLGGRPEYGQLAKRLLMDAAQWDPKGSTGYRYNDEAGMPYNYYFSRTYTFVNDLLAEEEKGKCRQVMAVRGQEMYKHLCPRHLWKPYASHSNRAWHFLGEVGIAFLGEIPDAEQWVWFAANVFYNVYPAWCDSDGGWHEGASYWSSYISRFTWWADVMRVAMRVNAYQKPYFSRIGYYPMYLQPPGTRGGGFGDLTAHRTSGHNRGLMTILAAQANNPYWQWYVDAHGGSAPTGGYVGFIRGRLPKVKAKPPLDLPTSRCFWGTGQAMLNTNLLDAKDNVEIVFKSSPFGSQSHGYEAQNSFLLYAFGERLLIRTGRRDSYGSKHHKQWMWHTKSTNCITIDGEGQPARSRSAVGQISSFYTSEHFDYVAGEAGNAYGKRLSRFTRSMLFVKPDLVIIHDRLAAPEASTFEWLLHSATEMKAPSQDEIRVVNKGAACRVALLAPRGLKLSLTDQFDVPPRPRIKLVEWHLTAQTPRKTRRAEFIAAIDVHRSADKPRPAPVLKDTPGGYAIEAECAGGRVVVAIRADGSDTVRYADLATNGDLAALRYDRHGEAVASLVVDGAAVRPDSGAAQ